MNPETGDLKWHEEIKIPKFKKSKRFKTPMDGPRRERRKLGPKKSQMEEAEEVEAPTPKSTAGKIFILVFKNQKASGILHKVYTSRNYAESAYSREVKKDSGPRLYDVLEVMEIVDVESEVIATDSPLF